MDELLSQLVNELRPVKFVQNVDIMMVRNCSKSENGLVLFVRHIIIETSMLASIF